MLPSLLTPGGAHKVHIYGDTYTREEPKQLATAQTKRHIAVQFSEPFPTCTYSPHLLRRFLFLQLFFFVSLSTVDGVASDKIGTSSAVGMHEERLQKFIEEEVLGDGTTLESLLQVEADVQSGSTTAAHEKQKLLSKTRKVLANKMATHLLNEHREGANNPESGLDRSSEGCRKKLDKWMFSCAFKPSR